MTLKSKILFISYLLFGVLSSSYCQTDVLVGHYIGGVSYETMHDLNLFKDGSFQFIIKEGLFCDTIFGHWNVMENKQMILKPIKIKSYHIESKCDTCSNDFFIKTFALLDKDELTGASIKVYSKGDIIKDGIANSIGYDIMQKADSIKVNYVGFESYLFTPQNKRTTIVNIFMLDELHEKLQKDVILNLQKNRILTKQGLKLIKQLN